MDRAERRELPREERSVVSFPLVELTVVYLSILSWLSQIKMEMGSKYIVMRFGRQFSVLKSLLL